MEPPKFHSLSPNEDVTIINLRSQLLILEMPHINQKMVNKCAFTYHGNQVQAIHRSMADMVSLSEALANIGFRCTVLGCLGVPMQTLKWQPIVLIKTALGFKLSIMSAKVQLYRILIYNIHPLF